MRRFPDTPIMCLKVSDDIDAVIWVKKCIGIIDAVFDLNRMIRDSSLALQQLRWPSGKSVRLRSCRLGFDSESGQTIDFKS